MITRRIWRPLSLNMVLCPSGSRACHLPPMDKPLVASGVACAPIPNFEYNRRAQRSVARLVKLDATETDSVVALFVSSLEYLLVECRHLGVTRKEMVPFLRAQLSLSSMASPQKTSTASPFPSRERITQVFDHLCSLSATPHSKENIAFMGEVFTVLLDIAALSILEERGLSSEEPLLLHEGSAVWDGLSHLYIIFYEAFYTVIQEGEMKELSPTNFINKYECPAEQKESFLNVLKGYTSEVEWSELALPPTAPLSEADNSKEDRPSSIGTSAPRSPLHIIRDQWGESPSFVKVSSALSDGFARSAVDWESLSKTVEREFLPVYKRLKRSYAESVSLFYLTWSDFQKSKLPIAFKFSVLVLYCEMLLSGGPINQPALYKLLLESFKALGEDRLAHGSFPFVLLLNQLTLKFVLVYDMHVLVVWELFQQSPHKERILAAYNAVCRTKGCEAAVRLFGRFLEYTNNSEEGNVLSLFVKSLSELLDTHIKPTGPVPGHIQYLLSSTFPRCTTAYLHSLDTTPSVEALDVMRHGVRILNVMSILCDYVFIPERRAHRQAKRCVTVGPTFPSEQASNGGGSSLSAALPAEYPLKDEQAEFLKVLATLVMTLLSTIVDAPPTAGSISICFPSVKDLTKFMSVAGVVTREIDFNASERILHSLEKVVWHFEKRDLLDPHAIVSFFRISAAVRFGCPALPSTVHRLTRRAFRSVVGVTPSEELTNVAIQGMRCIARGVAVAHHERAHQMMLHFAFVAASGAVDVSNVLLWDAFFEGLFYRCTNPNSLFQRPPWSEAQFWQSVWQPWPSPRPQLALLLCKGLLASNRMEEARALLPMVELETVMTSLFGVERSPTHYDIGELHLLLFYASCDHTGSSAASAQRIVKELHERSGSHLKEQYGTLWRSWESDASNVKKLTVERVRGPPQEVCVRPYDGRPCVMLRSDTTEEEIQFFFSSTGDGTYPYRCYSKVGGWYDHYHPTEEKKSDPQISTKYVLTISSITKQ